MRGAPTRLDDPTNHKPKCNAKRDQAHGGLKLCIARQQICALVSIISFKGYRMKLGHFIAIIVAAIGALAASNASAASCANRGDLINRLETRFGETAVANAISASGNILEVYATTDVTSWTILLTLPGENLSCLVAHGAGELEMQAALEKL